MCGAPIVEHRSCMQALYLDTLITRQIHATRLHVCPLYLFFAREEEGNRGGRYRKRVLAGYWSLWRRLLSRGEWLRDMPCQLPLSPDGRVRRCPTLRWCKYLRWQLFRRFPGSVVIGNNGLVPGVVKIFPGPKTQRHASGERRGPRGASPVGMGPGEPCEGSDRMFFSQRGPGQLSGPWPSSTRWLLARRRSTVDSISACASDVDRMSILKSSSMLLLLVYMAAVLYDMPRRVCGCTRAAALPQNPRNITIQTSINGCLPPHLWTTRCF